MSLFALVTAAVVPAASYVTPCRSVLSSRRPLEVRMQEPEPKKKPALVEAEKLANGAAVFFGGLAKAAEDAADTWVNSGWQVKKRAGQVIPEIRPNALDIGERTTEYLALPADGEAPAPSNGEATPGGGLSVDAGTSAALTTPQADALSVRAPAPPRPDLERAPCGSPRETRLADA